MPFTGDEAHNLGLGLLGNPTGDLLVHETMLSPLNHTSQANYVLKTISIKKFVIYKNSSAKIETQIMLLLRAYTPIHIYT